MGWFKINQVVRVLLVFVFPCSVKITCRDHPGLFLQSEQPKRRSTVKLFPMHLFWLIKAESGIRCWGPNLRFRDYSVAFLYLHFVFRFTILRLSSWISSALSLDSAKRSFSKEDFVKIRHLVCFSILPVWASKLAWWLRPCDIAVLLSAPSWFLLLFWGLMVCGGCCLARFLEATSPNWFGDCWKTTLVP